MAALDIDFLQCLLGDPNHPDFYWHHRVLLVGGKDGLWIWLTPKGEVQCGKLGPGVALVPLRRNAAFPDGLDRANICSFDPISAHELQCRFAEALSFAKIIGLGDDPVLGSVAEWHWFFPDFSTNAQEETAPRSSPSPSSSLVVGWLFNSTDGTLRISSAQDQEDSAPSSSSASRAANMDVMPRTPPRNSGQTLSTRVQEDSAPFSAAASSKTKDPGGRGGGGT